MVDTGLKLLTLLLLSLFQILASVRTSFAAATSDANGSNSAHATPPSARLATFPIGHVDDLVNRHFRATQSAPLAVTGRYRELLYILVATLITPPHNKTVAMVDFEGRFDPLRLLATSPVGEAALTRAASQQPRLGVQPADLDHLHILRPAHGSPAHIAKCVASIQEYMLYGSHRSRAREWWGTIVIGGGLNPAGAVSAAASPVQVAVTAGWKGWLRVDRAEVLTFWDLSAEEALADRDKRQAAVDEAGWAASSPWGGFTIGAREGSR